MSIYNPEIYEEKIFIEKYPKIFKILCKKLEEAGIDIKKYYFSQFLGLATFSITYNNKKDENLSFTMNINMETYQIESLELTTD